MKYLKQIKSNLMTLYFKRQRKKRWRRIMLAIFFILVIICAGTIYSFEKFYADKIFPGVRLGPYNLGGKTQEEASQIIQQLIDRIDKGGLNFVYQNKRVNINPIIFSPADPDFSYKILNINNQKTLEKIIAVGRGGNWFQNTNEQWKSLLGEIGIPVIYQLNETELRSILKENFKSSENPAQDAQLEIVEDQVEIISESLGTVFDYDGAISEIRQSIESLEIRPVYLSLITDYPKIRKENVAWAAELVEEILKTGSIILKYNERWWRINPEQYGQWLEFVYDKNITIGLAKEAVIQYLQSIAEDIDLSSRDAKFKMNNDKTRVVEFQSSRQGRQLNLEESYKKINQEIIDNKTSEIELVVDMIFPKVVEEDLNNLGIKELIGRGISDFKGSPPNRVHNIKVGAKQLHGILIKPDEEFSLIKALGRIDADAGYKQELVIKGNRTIPEYGGGLCQIGTTAFRVALGSGLPILERRNHSYRVSYYEPAGMDATIYPPHPDLKFKNDTGHYILFQTRIEGTELIFEFYGTKDDRKIEISPDPPEIYNFRKPGPTKIIETEDLKPGQKKCIEGSHTGADTKFTYKVSYPDNRINEQIFKSHYIPWQAVCLVGKALDSEQSQEEPEKEVEEIDG